MQYYAAPMEALTGYIFRQTQAEFYGGVDRYFTPFLVGLNFSVRERNEILPEHNTGLETIPQILTNHADEFLYMANKLSRRYGYTEVNLNLGCPSPVVASKNRGSGFLNVPDQLDRFLDEIFTKCPLKISVKTRIGVNDSDSWPRILEIYDRYPLSELIIHPRFRKQAYTGRPDMEAFRYAMRVSHHPLVFNGDINGLGDQRALLSGLSEIDASARSLSGTASVSDPILGIMCGRGLIAHPWLMKELRGEPYDDSRETLLAFSAELYVRYRGIMENERSILCKMKELWNYFYINFPEVPDLLTQVRSCRTLRDYDQLIARLKTDVL